MFGSLFSFKGRIGVATYWKTKIAVAVVGVAIGLYIVQAGHSQPGDKHAFERGRQILDPFLRVAVIVVYALGGWILAATFAKRLHDLDKSGWWAR